MLPRHHRLRYSADLGQVREHGRRWRHPLIILLAKENEQDGSRFSFLASRRVGKAVVRNRAKRLMREAIRLHLDEIEGGWDCLLISRAKTPTATFSEVETAVLQLLSRARLLRKESPGRAEI